MCQGSQTSKRQSGTRSSPSLKVNMQSLDVFLSQLESHRKIFLSMFSQNPKPHPIQLSGPDWPPWRYLIHTPAHLFSQSTKPAPSTEQPRLSCTDTVRRKSQSQPAWSQLSFSKPRKPLPSSLSLPFSLAHTSTIFPTAPDDFPPKGRKIPHAPLLSFRLSPFIMSASTSDSKAEK